MIPSPARADETHQPTRTDPRIAPHRHPRHATADLLPKSRDFR
jgi:hypothetical protein